MNHCIQRYKLCKIVCVLYTMNLYTSVHCIQLYMPIPGPIPDQGE